MVLLPRAVAVIRSRFTARILLVAGLTVPACGAEGPQWRVLAPGVEYAAIDLVSERTPGEGLLHVVRVDPQRAALRAHLSSERGERSRTARDWCVEKDLLVAINLGMYQADLRTNVGYARKGSHVNNRSFNAYRSYLAFGPLRPGLPAAVLVDAEERDARDRLEQYDTVVQNLRLIRAPGTNVWSRQERRWSESAVAADRAGRILLLFTPAAFTMWEFNQLILGLPLDVERAMHVEGGPEASLSIHSPALELHLAGSQPVLSERVGAAAQWPLPNVLGVAATRDSAPPSPR